ncbi:hypothetical protein BGX29_007837 [Mortierella sp. GBA35]|nr:hypothetical protein BGX29_007837 [Mortierella sp. GBA35]
MSQEIKRPAKSLSFSLAPLVSPMTPIDSSRIGVGHPYKSTKLSSTDRTPFFNLGLGYSSPSSLKNCRHNNSISSLSCSPAAQLMGDLPANASSMTFKLPSSSSSSLSSSSPSSAAGGRPAMTMSYNVRFPPSEESKTESKTGYLPRTPYPLTREEDERIFESFLTALNEEEE